MTEASHQMAGNPLPPGKQKAGSVGLPAGVEMALMDEAGQLLPAGATGEIVIRGPGVFDGYEHNPDADAAAFVQGWFRTGDQGRFDEDGYLFITGRLKELINRGGEKISPREIDDALLEHADVAQAAAFAVPHPTLGENVAAAVVLREGAVTDESELRRFLLERLASFKVPSSIDFVDAIPKGPTGKIQRTNLHRDLGSAMAKARVAPRTDAQDGTDVSPRSLSRTTCRIQPVLAAGTQTCRAPTPSRRMATCDIDAGPESPIAGFLGVPCVASSTSQRARGLPEGAVGRLRRHRPRRPAHRRAGSDAAGAGRGGRAGRAGRRSEDSAAAGGVIPP